MKFETKKYYGEDLFLSYKKQDPFFNDYYEYRRQALEAKNKILFDERKEFLLKITALIDFTVNYIDNYEDKIKIVDELLKNYKNMDKKEFRKKANQLWEEISKDHVKYEILPRPNYVNDEEEEEELTLFWKNESHKGLRELKKVISDVFKAQLN